MESVQVRPDASTAFDPNYLNASLEGARIALVGGDSAAADLLADALREHGAEVLRLAPAGTETDAARTVDLYDEAAIEDALDGPLPIGGIVDLLGFTSDHGTPDELHDAARQTFHLARAWRSHLGDSPDEQQFWTSVTGMGGRLGMDAGGQASPVAGAVAGLTKSLAREWPSAHVRVVDLPTEGLHPDLARQVLAETLQDGPSPEVGLLDGVRYLPETTRVADGEDAGESYAPGPEDTVLVAGGGKGITARVASDLAERYGCNLALVGRTELELDDPLSVDMDRAEERARERIEERGERVTPVRVDEELKPLRSQRSIQENMDDMRAAGADVAYFSCDVGVREDVETLADDVRERFGSIDGVVHGAGAERSKMLVDKTAESFDVVFDGKALGGVNLWEAVAGDAPDFFAVFSSVVARYGNIGQTDYCAANEALNKLVSRIDSTTDTTGLAVDWTAWDDVGMAAGGSVETILKRSGVQFIPPELGAPALARALELGVRGESMVAGALGELSAPYDMRRVPPGERAADTHPFVGDVVERDGDRRLVLERTFDPEADHFLADHELEDTPVMPGVMGYELMAQAVRKLTGADPSGVTDVEFDKALKFHRSEPTRVIATAERNDDGSIAVTIESERTVKTGRTVRNEHFTGRVEIGEPTELSGPGAFDPDGDWEVGPDRPAIYREFFHTGVFQVMETVPHVGNDAVVGYARKPRQRLAETPVDEGLLTDPMVREAVFQTAGLWGMIRHDSNFLPLAVEESATYDTAERGERLYVRARRRPEDDGDRTLYFDAEVLGSDGRLLQRSNGVVMIDIGSLDAAESFTDRPRRRMSLERLGAAAARARLDDADYTVEDVLTDGEQQSLDRLKDERRRGEWLAARVAAKDLLRDYVRNFRGIDIEPPAFEIEKDEHGAPHATVEDADDRDLVTDDLPSLTLTHAKGLAIAGIEGPGHPARVGIDLEAVESRGEHFGENYFTEHERTLSFPDEDGEPVDDDAVWTVLWSIKEATSKALGLGLKLALGELHVDALVRRDGHIRAELTLGGRARDAFEELGAEDLEVRARLDGSYALASAHVALVDAETDRQVSVDDANGNGRAATHASGKDEVADGPSEEYAAVAALLKHKGLLDAERETSNASKPRSSLSSWSSTTKS